MAMQPNSVFIGKKRMKELVMEIRAANKMTNEEIAAELNLTREGLFNITNRSGRITTDKLDLFKKLYKKALRKEADIEEVQSSNNLSSFELEELITEIKRRGGKVLFD